MESMLHYLHVLAAGLVVGKVTLLSFVVAPILARQLDGEAFSRVVRQLFPAYYAMGMGAALAGLSASGGLGLVRGPSATLALVLGSWMVILAAESYCRAPLTPRSNVMRDELKVQQARGEVDRRLQEAWERLHRRSLYLNAFVLVGGLGVLGLATVLMS